MGQVQWTRSFLAEQGQHIPTTTYNMTIKVPYYWQRTGGHQARKKDMQYYCTVCSPKNKKGEIKVAYCPNTNMLGTSLQNPYKVEYSEKCGATY